MTDTATPQLTTALGDLAELQCGMITDAQAEALAWTKREYPQVWIGGGNVVGAEVFDFLAEAGADFVKVGVGGGSICITRDQKGIGRGQASAVLDVAAVRARFDQAPGAKVPTKDGFVKEYWGEGSARAQNWQR